MASLKSMYTQFFPPSPTFTAASLTSQPGKVFLVTGGNKGVGLSLATFLFQTGATTYITSRSIALAEKAIQHILTSNPDQDASKLRYLILDLEDLSTVKRAAEEFASKEKRLDILFNNAGVGGMPVGSRTRHGFEFHVGVNCIGPLVFTELLKPLLQAAVGSSDVGSVRVIWSTSYMAEGASVKGGVDFEFLEGHGGNDNGVNYGTSKAGVWFLGIEAARRWKEDGIVSLVQNPGNLKTDAYERQPWWQMLMVNRLLFPAKMGAYTGLYAGFSKEVKTGEHVIPWGRVEVSTPRKDIIESIENGIPEQFWEWCETKSKSFV